MINKKVRSDRYEEKREWKIEVDKGEVYLEVIFYFLLRSRGGVSCLRVGDRWSRLYDVEVGSRGKVLKE